MKRIYLLLIALIGSLTIQAQIVVIPDSNFKASLIALGLDKNKNGEIDKGETYSLIELDVSNKGIKDLTGIEVFIQLFNLDCSNNSITKLDISKNTYLTNLDVSHNLLRGINLTKNQMLRTLLCDHNSIETLDLSTNSSISTLSCSHNQLATLGISNLNLYSLDISNNLLASLDLSKSTNLNFLICDSNKITGILDPSACAELSQLLCHGNSIQDIRISDNVKLTELNCSSNNLKKLDVRLLEELKALDVTNNPDLSYICVNNVEATKSNTLFIKDLIADWTEECALITSTSDSHSSLPVVITTLNNGAIEVRLKESSDIHVFYADGSSKAAYKQVENVVFGQSFTPGIYLMVVSNPNKSQSYKVIKQ